MPTDNNSNLNTSAFAALLSKMVGDKDREKIDKKLEEAMKSLNKSILSLADGLVNNKEVAGNIMRITSSRPLYGTVTENVRNKLFGMGDRTLKSRFGSVRGLLDTTGVVNRGSGGILDQFMERRDAKKQFIKDQLKVNPSMDDTVANRKTFGKKFDNQQVIQKDIAKLTTEIERLSAGGFTDKQIGRTGLDEKRDALLMKLAASDNRLYETIRDEVTDEIREGIKEGMMAEMKDMKQPGSTEAEDYMITPEELAERTASLKASEKREEELNANVEILKNNSEEKRKQDKDKPEDNDTKSGFGKIISSLLSMFTGKFGTIIKILGTVAAVATGIFGGLGKLLGFAVPTISAAGIASKLPSIKNILKPTGLLGKIGTTVAAVAKTVALPIALGAAAVGAGHMIGNKINEYLPETAKETIGKGVVSLIPGLKITSKEDLDKAGNRLVSPTPSPNRILNGETLSNKSDENVIQKMKMSGIKSDSPTIVNAPVVTNNNNSSVHQYMKSSPRNSEQSYNNYVNNHYLR